MPNKTDEKRKKVEKFQEEYRKLSKKHGFDFHAQTACTSKLLSFFIKIIGQKHLVTKMFIKDV